jgi:pyruvate,orthophosphate dikinase
MEGDPVTIRFLDPPLHEFVPNTEEEIELLAKTVGKTVEQVKDIIAGLHEFNPMMGHRGCRLAVTYPEIASMQTRAVIRAALNVQQRHSEWTVVPEIMIPLVGEVKELKYVKDVVVKTADEEIAAAGVAMKYKVGTMIEIPRAALTADQIAKEAEFFSFGTNDLTQMTFGFSRDDAAKFLGSYYDKKIYENDPFAKLDQVGVGKLVEMAAKLGRATRPDLHLGICGEHGGEPTSVAFCHRVGLDYVSCSPFRVPIARLAAAQAAIAEEKEKSAGAAAGEKAAEATRAAKDQVDEKVEAAKAALKEAAEQLTYLAAGATGELKEVVSAGFKSLLAGWEEAKKTYGETRNK